MKIRVTHHEFREGAFHYVERADAELITPNELLRDEDGRRVSVPPHELWIRIGSEVIAIKRSDLESYLTSSRRGAPMPTTRSRKTGVSSEKGRTVH